MAVFGGLSQSFNDRGRGAVTTNTGKRIRLLKVVVNFESGGTERQVANLVRDLDPAGFDLEFACLEKCGPYLDEYAGNNIPITEFRIGSLYSPAFIIRILRFAAYMRSRQFDIVHAYNFYSLVFAIPAAKLAGVPVVIASIRDRGVYLSGMKRWVQKLVCGLADRVLVNADSIRDWLLEEGYAAERIAVIKNGIDLTRYGRTNVESVRKEWALPPVAPLILMVARLNTKKGVEEIIRAAAIVTRRHPESRFVLVGRPSESSLRINGAGSCDVQNWMTLIDRLNLEGKVIFTGHRTDIPALLGAATVSVLPSHNEGLSNTLLESMASGTPVVATDVGGNPELVEDGITGLLVPRMNPEALASAIDRLLEDPELATRLGNAARKKVALRFSNEVMVQQTQKLYLREVGV
ncbi:MAG: glycosyltransferase [Pseudohongiellaceae bacterium]